MDNQKSKNPINLTGQIAVVTGGAGVICSKLCRMLADEGVKVAILDLNTKAAESLAAELRSAGGDAIGLTCNVLDKASLEKAAEKIMTTFGRVDMLLNGAGGNKPRATTSADTSFFDLPSDAMRWVIDLNLMGIVIPSQIFGKIMAGQKKGVILNFSSMNSYRPLTRIQAYSVANAGVSNFTQWLAVYMATNYSPDIRVNAIAPGFLVGEQNRRLLFNEDGSLTPHGQAIIKHTPMGRFAIPEDLFGTVLWLLSPASAFVTGMVVPVDGGFTALDEIE
jgi:NAD(P)-dependent dehydrogenase (short-subunit alcohol dehydrogenase family)